MTELEQVTATLGELRRLLEENREHLRIAGERFAELRSDLDQLRRDCIVDFKSVRKRLDEIRPIRPACPHCGRAVQKDWTACRVCGKAI